MNPPLAPSPAGPAEILQAKERWLIPCTRHFYKQPPLIVEGRGSWLFDQEGRRYLDCVSGVGVMNAGHGNRAIIDAAFAQAGRLQHTTSIFLTEPIVQLAEALASVAPGDLDRSFFCASGSEANEGAMMLAAMHTGRREFIAMDAGLHGRTRQALSATGIAMWRVDPDPLPNVHFVRRPRSEAETGRCLDELEHCVRSVGPERIAGILIEPVAGNGGIYPAPDVYLRETHALCERHGSLMIADEIQTGFGRTGRWFACESAGIVPHVMTVAKALGNGFPIAAFVTNRTIAQAWSRPGASTFGGNPMCSAAALATIAFHQEHALAERSADFGPFIAERLDRLRRFASVADVRGRGMMNGIELIDRQGEPDPARCDAILETMKDAGYLMGKAGAARNVLTIMPPLTTDREDLDALLTALENALADGEAH